MLRGAHGSPFLLVPLPSLDAPALAPGLQAGTLPDQRPRPAARKCCEEVHGEIWVHSEFLVP